MTEIKANILGTMYAIRTGVKREEDKNLDGLIGFCNHFTKTISVVDLAGDDMSDVVKQVTIKETIRHEIIHAFIHESGLWACALPVNSWADNEEMVDWIALQFPKILNAVQEADAL
jgi:hypothetical protein